MRTHFSWSKGFLKAHKPPTCWPTPTIRQPRHHPSTKQGPNDTPSTAVGNCPITTEPGSEKSSFLQCYDLWLYLHDMDGATHSKWEGVTNLLLQMQMIDDTIEMWPWAVKDQHPHNLPIAIMTVAWSFFDLQMYLV